MYQALLEQLRAEFLALPRAAWIAFAAFLLIALLIDLVLKRAHTRHCRSIEAKCATLETRLSSLEVHRERELLGRMRGPRDVATEAPRVVRSV